MKITLYEPWMKNQIIDLFVAQYDVDFNDFDKLFVQFYEGDFQKEKSIRIVALDDKVVAGFQSFFYWPYVKGDTTYNSYQSGNSLVHPDYRGKGVFKKLLEHLEVVKDQFDLDFLVGFPVEASKNSFLKNGWDNILNLNWYTKFVSIKSLFFKKTPLNIGDGTYVGLESNDCFKLSRNEDFLKWRESYSSSEGYFNYTYQSGKDTVMFECKLQVRKKFLKEVIIGNMHTNIDNLETIEEALKEFRKKLQKTSLATFISIALVENSDSLMYKALINQKYSRNKKKIYFIVKSYKEELDVAHSMQWELFRSDIDTW